MNVNKRYYIQIFIIYWVLFSGYKLEHTPSMSVELVRVGNGSNGIRGVVLVIIL